VSLGRSVGRNSAAVVLCTHKTHPKGRAPGERTSAHAATASLFCTSAALAHAAAAFLAFPLPLTERRRENLPRAVNAGSDAKSACLRVRLPCTPLI
jgi:hypothetical protein